MPPAPAAAPRGSVDRPATPPAAEPASLEIIFLGDSLTAGLGPRRRGRAFRRSSSSGSTRAGLRVRGGQRRRLRRHVGRRAAAARVGAGRGRSAGARRRARRQRRPARPAARANSKQNLAAIIEPGSSARPRGDSGRHGSAAELRRRTTRRASARSIRTLAETLRGAADSVPARRRGRRSGAQSGRRHPSQPPRARSVVADHGVARARAGSSTPRVSTPDDRAARRQQDRPERRRSRSPSCIRSTSTVPRRAVPGDHRARRAAASRRCSA